MEIKSRRCFAIYLLYQYFQITQDIEWDIITNELEDLRKNLIKIKENEIEE
jgi:uncharacterized protein with HEPN domain